MDKTREIAVRLLEIKQKHGLSPQFEVKWTKVSPVKKGFYLDLIDYFFDDDDLHFRARSCPMQAVRCCVTTRFPARTMMRGITKCTLTCSKSSCRPDARYRIYFDIKDTRGAAKAAKLHDVLCNDRYDFSR